MSFIGDNELVHEVPPATRATLAFERHRSEVPNSAPRRRRRGRGRGDETKAGRTPEHRKEKDVCSPHEEELMLSSKRAGGTNNPNTCSPCFCGASGPCLNTSEQHTEHCSYSVPTANLTRVPFTSVFTALKTAFPRAVSIQSYLPASAPMRHDGHKSSFASLGCRLLD